jgi:hypothetical protein
VGSKEVGGEMGKREGKGIIEKDKRRGRKRKG